MLTRILIILGGYVFGLFQTGYLLGLKMHKDIRTAGSGNSGATNALRVLGVKAGLTVFFGDLLKAMIYCAIVRWGLGYSAEMANLLMLYGGIGVVLGHTYPFYLGFKGGKGIASTAGVILMYDYRIALICLAVFALIVYTTRYVSLGSLTAMTLFLALEWIFHVTGLHVLPTVHATEMLVVTLVFVLLSFYSHRSNIVRLLHGEENKIGLKK